MATQVSKKAREAVNAIFNVVAAGARAKDAALFIATDTEAQAHFVEKACAAAARENTKSPEAVKVLRANLRKWDQGFMETSPGVFRLAEDGEILGAPLTFIVSRDKSGNYAYGEIKFAKSNSRSQSDPVETALKAYIKACRESEDNIDLARAVEMLNAEWTDEEPSH